VLQDRLAASLHTRALHAASRLPAQTRGQFVAGFSHASSSGFQVGRGQSGSHLHLPPHVPASTIQQIASVAHSVFTHAFVDAMKPALLMPITIVVIAAVGCFAVRAAGPLPATDRAGEAVA
jgi:hypothetical protein